jgi:hypothetical protein
MYYLKRSDETAAIALQNHGGVGQGYDTRQQAINDVLNVWAEDCDHVEMGQWEDETDTWTTTKVWTAEDLEEMKAGG